MPRLSAVQRFSWHFGWPIIVGLFLAVSGFTAAQARANFVAAPVLRQPTGVIRLAGRVVAVEPLEKGERVILDHLQGGGIEQMGLARIRIKLRAGYPLRPGQRIRLRASLMPPPLPIFPGGYDFTRQAWFQQLGAVGFAMGRPVILGEPPANRFYDKVVLRWARIRQDLTARIVSAIDDNAAIAGIGVVAAALVTGQRGPVAPEVLQSYRDAGLAHVLVIAGMHLSMVTGLVLLALRFVLAAIPALALRFPIHKWAAGGALAVTFAYMMISGAPVPTQRAFIMNGAILAALLLDRQPLSLRSITFAALIVLTFQPESLVGASFQLSFAAVYGLVAAYEALAPTLGGWHRAAQAPWQKFFLYAIGILLTTQVAGTATAFYNLYHFQRYALYSLLGNCLAVPIVGIWVMPSALLAVCLMPFGLDYLGWQAMGLGLAQVGKIANWVSHLPHATISVPLFPADSLVVFSFGAAWLVLWRGPWRLAGIMPMAAAILLIFLTKPPDLLIDGDVKLVALRESDGRLHLVPGRNARSMRQAWAQMAGETDGFPPPTGTADFACQSEGCRLQIEGHDHWIALDRPKWRREGTHEIWLQGDGAPPIIRSVRDWQGERPWRFPD